jgi:hypothetical protein
MFVQVIRGKVSDPERVHAAMERWMRELAPGASGWLGSTAGVTEDGRFVALARFESREAAQRNSARPEQDAWWSEVSKAFDGEATFADSEDVDVDIVGDPDSAGFVQVMAGRATNARRVRELMDSSRDAMHAFRPDILGSVDVLQDDGRFTTAVYFRSEQEAREGERKEPTPEVARVMEEMNSLASGEIEFLDLKNPWLHSPR